MDELERAILAGLSPASDSELRAQAMHYFQSLKEDHQGWQVCLALFLADQPKRAPEARFIALQGPEDLLRNRLKYSAIDPSLLLALRQSLWTWLEKGVDESDPDFLKNKFCQVLVLLFRIQYQTAWPSFCDDLLSLLASTSSATASSPSSNPRRHELMVQMFLRICLCIDEEVVAIDAAGRTDEDLVLNTAVKDKMRESDVVKLRDAWFSLFFTHTVGLEAELSERGDSQSSSGRGGGGSGNHKLSVLSGPNRAMSTGGYSLSSSSSAFASTTSSAAAAAASSSSISGASIEIAATCLKLVSLYVSWIDIKLVVVQEFIGRLYVCLRHPALRIPALQCLMGILDKGMSNPDKVELVEHLRAVELLESVWTLSGSGSGSGSASGILEVGLFTGSGSGVVDNDDELLDQVAKYVNALGIELCRCWDHMPPTVDARGRALAQLQRLLPYALGVMANAFDDTSIIVFPFIDEFLKLLNHAVNKPQMAVGVVSAGAGTGRGMMLEDVPKFVEESMVTLLRVILAKTKYDEEEEYSFGKNAGEDEALFQEMRRNLKAKMEQIDDRLFCSYLSNLVTGTFDAVIAAAETGKPMTSVVKWSDVELALYLLHIHKATAVYVLPDGSPSPVAVMLTKMIKSGVCSYPHPAIPLIYFEVIVRYIQFYQHNPDYIPIVLESFIDARGLHYPDTVVQSRLFYLFLRFLKEGKDFKRILKPYASKMVASLQDLLVLQPPQSSPPQNPPVMSLQRSLSSSSSSLLSDSKSETSDGSFFDSQLFLFEAAGYLISLEADSGKQEELLQLVVAPLMVSMKHILDGALYKMDSSPDNMPITTHLKQLITAVGSVGKGFPDYDVAANASVVHPLWASVFKEAMKLIIMVLQQLSQFEMIRESIRFAFQRLIGCVGSDILPLFQPMMEAGLLSNCTMKELSNFLASMVQVMFKFKTAIFPILNEIIVPLIERVFVDLNLTPSGYDERNDLIDLRRAYLTFLGGIFLYELDNVLVTEGNSPFLRTILQSCLHYSLDPSDPISQKLAISVFTKMVISWGSAAKASPSNNESDSRPTTLLSIQTHHTTRSAKGQRKTGMVGTASPPNQHDPNDTTNNNKPAGSDKKTFKEIVPIGTGGKTPLPGFEKFIYDSLAPSILQIPLKPGFDPTDAQTQHVFSELAMLHKRILIVQGLEYLEFLGAYLPTLQCPPQLCMQFTMSLQQLPTKEFQALLKTFGR